MPDIQKTSVAVTGDQLARLRQAGVPGKESGGREPVDVEAMLAKAAARRPD